MDLTGPGVDVLLEHIKDERGFDFTGYKRASLARRIQRRVDALGIDTAEDYLDFLVLHPEEFTILFNTILINVTAFFRDPDAWTYLSEAVLPDLLARREGQPVRVWAAGCASGEEAVTVAIVLAEALGVDEFRRRVKIYATDVDDEALAEGRQATYSAKRLESMPAHLRDTYFDPVERGYSLRPELRRSLIFGRNDLVQDAPISHVDLLLCRNTLMYFNAETQARILNRLHFALRSDGVLFLGKAEMLLSHAAYFRAIELKQRVFAKVATQRRDRGSLDPGELYSPGGQEAETERLRTAALMSSASAQIVLDADGRLVIGNHRATSLFNLSPRDVGQAIQDLDLSYRPLELRSHIEEATSSRRAVWVRDVELVRGTAERLLLDVQFVPLADQTGNHLGVTVIFNDITQHRRLQDELIDSNRQLETAYEELQSTNEELETTNEELQSTVEELETTNEELQSTNEELETMNEELQSMNDELHYVNGELRDRQSEVDRLNRFSAAVLGSLSGAVVVVDRELTVLAWNDRATDLWGVRSDEAVGQRLTELDIGLPVDRLRGPVVDQLADGGADLDTHVEEVEAINRRGRSVRLRVSVSSLRDHGGPAPAAVLVMDEALDGSAPP